MGANNLIRLKLTVSRLIGALPPRLREGQKAVGMRRLKLLNGFIQPFPDSTGEVDHNANIFSIHEGKHCVDWRGILHLLAYANSVRMFGDCGKVRMDIN